MFNSAYCRLLAIGVYLVKKFVDCSTNYPTSVIQRAVLFFVDSFKLCVKQAKNGIYESI